MGHTVPMPAFQGAVEASLFDQMQADCKTETGGPLPVRMKVGGAEAEGDHTQVMGHPIQSVQWLVDELDRVGAFLRELPDGADD